MPEAITNGLCVSVESEFIPERSNPDQPLFFFAYHITIKNEGDRPLTLKNRYWHITDAAGQVEEVRGPGVVGYQPRLEKDQSFQYTSFCPLRTEFGTMIPGKICVQGNSSVQSRSFYARTTSTWR